MHGRRLRPTPSMAVALLALAVALGGTAVAAKKIKTKDIGNGVVTTKKLKNKAVNAKKVKKDAVKTNKIKDGAVESGKLADGAVDGSKIAAGAVDGSKIADGAVDGSKVADGSLDDSKLSDYEVLGGSLLQVQAFSGTRANAPENPLFTKGPLELYAKCFFTGGTVFGEIFVRTTTNRSIMVGEDEHFGGNGAAPDDYVNTGTAETARQVDVESIAVNNTANYDDRESVVGATDGTALTVATGIAVKQGNLAPDNGPYLSGNSCLFHGAALG